MNAQKYWQLVFSAAEGDPDKLLTLVRTAGREITGIGHTSKAALTYVREIAAGIVAAIDEVLDNGHDAQPN